MEKNKRTNRTYSWCGAGGTMVLLLVALGMGGTGLGGLPQGHKLLPEPTVLDRVDGKVTHVDTNDTWFFELERDVNSVNVRVPAGTRLILLPSATLEKLIADMNDRVMPQYRLTVRVTQYQGRNYLIPTYFLPLSKLKSDEGAEPGAQTPTTSTFRMPDSNHPQLTIPREIVKQLQNRRPVRAPQRNPGSEEKPPGAKSESAPSERMLVDTVGLVQKEDGHFVLVPYALGWDLSDTCYEIMPSTVLEQTLHRQTSFPERIRFNVSGFVTEFRGRKYLLLQRAVPVYNYGDFGR